MNTQILPSEWIPALKPSSRLIVVLHGRGDSPEGFRWLPSALAYDDVNYLLLRAPDRYPPGFSWYDLPPNQGPGIVRSRDLLNRLFEEITEQGFRTEDTVLFGFSQGCLMTLEWGGRTERKFAGFVGISGYCYGPEALAKDMSETARHSRWLITHGLLDGVLDYSVTFKQVEFLKDAGLPIEFHSYRKAHTIDDGSEVPLLRQWIKASLDGAGQ